MRRAALHGVRTALALALLSGTGSGLLAAAAAADPPDEPGKSARADDDREHGRKDKDEARGRSGELPPGLEKRDELPPGLEKRDSHGEEAAEKRDRKDKGKGNEK